MEELYIVSTYTPQQGLDIKRRERREREMKPFLFFLHDCLLVSIQMVYRVKMVGLKKIILLA
jgi:hypothetical protein